tara:strand:+ start:7103 stop:7513 length:411 start_codon:yes stop_codon:yes gene_type:complete
MTYTEWLRLKKEFKEKWHGKRPKCRHCTVNLKPYMERINLEPTDEEKFNFYSRTNRFTGEEEFFINDEWIVPTDEQYFEYIMKKVNSTYSYGSPFRRKTDFSQEPKYWGVDRDSNFCSKQCGFDFGNITANLRKRG